jgi:hypothetical protein
MIRSVAALVGILFTATAYGPARAGSGLSDCGLMKSDCRDMIGKRLWIVVPKTNPNSVELSAVADDWTNTKKYKAGSFLVTGVQKDKFVSHNFIVKMFDGFSGFIGSGSWIFLSETDPFEDERKRLAAVSAAKVECERRGQPKIGMTVSELVETCWRKPVRIVKRTTTSGIEENYIYGVGHLVKVSDGKVSEIVEAR